MATKLGYILILIRLNIVHSPAKANMKSVLSFHTTNVLGITLSRSNWAFAAGE